MDLCYIRKGVRVRVRVFNSCENKKLSRNNSASGFSVVALLAAILLLGGCGGGGGGGGSSSGAGELVVRVVDDFQPTLNLAGATVTVTAGQTNKTATTPADGMVTFRDLPAGPATIVVTRDSYSNFTSTGTISGTASVGLTARMQRRTGQINVTAIDVFNTPVPNVNLTVNIEGRTITAVTGATGAAVLTGVPTAAVSVQATATGYQAEPPQAVTVVESPAASVQFAMDRQTEPGGGVVTPPGPPIPPTAGGQTLTFRIRVLVVNGQGQAIEDRQASNFTLVPCENADPARAECVRSSDPAFDAAYTPVNATPDVFTKVPAQAPVPFAAALSYDQSNSIGAADPTDARIFASKGFLQTVVGSSDRVLLAAFAGGTGFEIPTAPLSTYGTFTNDAAAIDGYFDTLDQFPTLEGGSTPLYKGLDALLQHTDVTAPDNMRKAVVIYSDGFDNDTANCPVKATCREASITLSRQLGVDIFTVSLAGSVHAQALAELAHRANGAHLVAANPEQLNALYASLGKLLQGAVSTYETTWTIQAASGGVFTSGRSVLGTVRVVTPEKTLDLPFLYTIP
jgi:hypothetical protein